MNLHGRGQSSGRCALSQPRCARTPSSLASASGFPLPHQLPCRCRLPQPLLFASRWVQPDDSRIRCGPRLSALEDQISLWLSGCDGKRLGNGAGELEAGEEDSWRCGGVSGELGRGITGPVILVLLPASPVGAPAPLRSASNRRPVFLRISISLNRCKADPWLYPSQFRLVRTWDWLSAPDREPAARTLRADSSPRKSVLTHSRPASKGRRTKSPRATLGTSMMSSEDPNRHISHSSFTPPKPRKLCLERVREGRWGKTKAAQRPCDLWPRTQELGACELCILPRDGTPGLRAPEP